jgi:hypothetical protein
MIVIRSLMVTAGEVENSDFAHLKQVGQLQLCRRRPARRAGGTGGGQDTYSMWIRFSYAQLYIALDKIDHGRPRPG